MTRQSVNFATILLCACMFASGACGIILEYIQASLASMILGNSFEQWAIVIGMMLFWMGFGSLIQTQVPKSKLIAAFFTVEIALALAGGFSPTLTYLAYGHTAHYNLALYFFVSIIGIMIGLEIPIIIRINNDYTRELSTNLGNILSADYLGSLAGALIYVYILIRYFPITEGAFVTAGINFILALITFIYFTRIGLLKKTVVMPVILLLTCSALVYGYTQNRDWNLRLEQPLYDDPIVLSRTTRYQHIVMTHYTPLDEVRLFLNGNLQFCSLDEVRYHEPMVHPIMHLVPVRKRVLILGGGDGCALREVLKYDDVESVLLVDLDPVMTQLASTHPLLTRINANAFRDARVVTRTGQGILPDGHRSVYMESQTTGFLKKINTTTRIADVEVMNVDADKFLETVKGFWDVIIVDMPDPSTPELVKLYSRQFYQKVRRRLSVNGMMVVQSTSPYLAKESFLCIGRTIESAGFSTLPFHENVPSFGDWGWHLAWHPSIRKDKVLSKARTLDFKVNTRFITPEVFRAELTFGKGQLETEDTRVNSVLAPALLTIYNHECWQVD
ncbi:MAG: polyamine aminopropyltransferase [Desulfobacteraceae bacterium]|nr:MAG: polyamine aminopropyltransferase [Desulfobacteraceae bacterium]